MEKLTLEQKQIIVELNHYIGRFNSKIQAEIFGDDAAFKILDLWISETLDLDYRNDIYNNKAVLELNRIDSVKDKFKEKFNLGWFVGDALKDVVYSACHHKTSTQTEIYNVDEKLKEVWEYFKSLTPTIKAEEELYVPAGVVMNGEELYKKVSK
jgi:hypothetical protein